MAWCVEVLGWAAATANDAQRAAVLFGTADMWWAQIGGSSATSWQATCEWHGRAQVQARVGLGASGFEAASEKGKRFTPEEAVAYVLGEPHPPATVSATAAMSETPLTRREHEVAELVAQGISNKGIASTLVIAQRTAEGHVEHILTKLGFTSRTQIAAWIADQRDTE